MLDRIRPSSPILIGMVLGMLPGCDGSGLEPARVENDTVEPDTMPALDTTPIEEVAEETPEPIDRTVFELVTELEPVTPTLRPLPSGVTEGATLVVRRSALRGRFLYGMGADPDGVVASLGGGAAGLMPLRSVIELVPDAPTDGSAAAPASTGSLEIRVYDERTGGATEGSDGLIESYAYVDLDAETIRVDFSAAKTELEIALYGSCRYTLDSYELRAPPAYADGLLTWPADERYTRSGECQWVPRTAEGLHVHYLRHELAGRDFVPRSLDLEAPFGFFLAGTAEAGEGDGYRLARLPGIAADEPAKTYTYHLVDFPEAMVPAARETFEAWNDALEEVTGRRPFEVAIAGDDIIAWDPRYHAVVWSDSGGGGAVAPFTEDPDSGEIFQSLVVMWFGDITDLVGSYRDFFGRHPDVGDALMPVSPGKAGGALPKFGGFDRRAAIARPVRPLDVAPRMLTTRPFVRRPPSGMDAEHVRDLRSRDYTDDEIAHVIVVDFLLHEVGHNLGLRHNFIASVDKRRHDETHTSTSTMDYVIGMLVPGSYDREAMVYGYGTPAAPDATDVAPVPVTDYTPYLYCTDETIDLDPACIQWDYGHPIRYQLGLIDAYFAAYPANSEAAAVEDGLRDLDPELNRVRQFINSEYERWDETDVATFEELLGKVSCGKDCAVHPALRSSLALYLLYTRHMVTAWWEPDYPDVWLDFPALHETQAALLMTTYFDLVVARGEPLDLKTTIVRKLPTSAVSGAVELLTQLHDHFASIEVSGEDVTLKAAIDKAFAESSFEDTASIESTRFGIQPMGRASSPPT